MGVIFLVQSPLFASNLGTILVAVTFCAVLCYNAILCALIPDSLTFDAAILCRFGGAESALISYFNFGCSTCFKFLD